MPAQCLPHCVQTYTDGGPGDTEGGAAWVGGPKWTTLFSEITKSLTSLMMPLVSRGMRVLLYELGQVNRSVHH